MYYRALKIITVGDRVLKQFHKSNGIKLTPEDIPMLFLCAELHLTGKQITRDGLMNHLRLLNKSVNDGILVPRMQKYEAYGYITLTKIPAKCGPWFRNIYSVTPLLIEHLQILERLFKKVRLDY